MKTLTRYQFLDKVGPESELTGCMEWLGYKDRKGYGYTSRFGHTMRAARAIWVEYNGPIDGDLMVLHSCDNPSCCNIAHLRLGTHADNMLDRRERKRTAAGERIANAKLTTREVRHMRRLAATMSYSELGSIFGVCKSAAHAVVNRVNWKTTT